MGETPVRSTLREKYCVLIPHPAQPKAFVVPRGDGWALPEFRPEREHPDLPDALPAIRAQLQVDASILYELRRYERAIPGALNIFVLELRTAAWTPTLEGRWIGSADLRDLKMPFAQQRRALQAWLAEVTGSLLPTIELPWWKPGWLTEVEGWLLPEARRLGYTPTGPVERQKSGYTSAIVKLPAVPAELYLKVMAPPLIHEAALLPVLAQQNPPRFPQVLASDVQQGWVLMRDMGGKPLGSNIPPERWMEIARAYAELQVAAAPRLAEWLALGSRDLRRPRLLEEIEYLVAYVPERLRGQNDDPSQPLVADIDVEALQAQGQKLKRLAEEVADTGLPPTLEHGDFHAGNVRVTEDGHILYDWSHATVTYPLVGLGDLLYDDDWFPDQPDFADRVRDVYLQPWTAFQPLSRLQSAYKRSRPLRKLYGAIHQGRLIQAHQERLGRQEYVQETPTGNSFQHLQWWFAEKLQALTRMELE
jgi:hypothetical protein